MVRWYERRSLESIKEIIKFLGSIYASLISASSTHSVCRCVLRETAEYQEIT